MACVMFVVEWLSVVIGSTALWNLVVAFLAVNFVAPEKVAWVAGGGHLLRKLLGKVLYSVFVAPLFAVWETSQMLTKGDADSWTLSNVMDFLSAPGRFGYTKYGLLGGFWYGLGGTPVTFWHLCRRAYLGKPPKGFPGTVKSVTVEGGEEDGLKVEVEEPRAAAESVWWIFPITWLIVVGYALYRLVLEPVGTSLFRRVADKLVPEGRKRGWETFWALVGLFAAGGFVFTKAVGWAAIFDRAVSLYDTVHGFLTGEGKAIPRIRSIDNWLSNCEIYQKLPASLQADYLNCIEKHLGVRHLLLASYLLNVETAWLRKHGGTTLAPSISMVPSTSTRMVEVVDPEDGTETTMAETIEEFEIRETVRLPRAGVGADGDLDAFGSAKFLAHWIEEHPFVEHRLDTAYGRAQALYVESRDFASANKVPLFAGFSVVVVVVLLWVFSGTIADLTARFLAWLEGTVGWKSERIEPSKMAEVSSAVAEDGHVAPKKLWSETWADRLKKAREAVGKRYDRVFLQHLSARWKPAPIGAGDVFAIAGEGKGKTKQGLRKKALAKGIAFTQPTHKRRTEWLYDIEHSAMVEVFQDDVAMLVRNGRFVEPQSYRAYVLHNAEKFDMTKEQFDDLMDPDWNIDAWVGKNYFREDRYHEFEDEDDYIREYDDFYAAYSDEENFEDEEREERRREDEREREEEREHEARASKRYRRGSITDSEESNTSDVEEEGKEKSSGKAKKAEKRKLWLQEKKEQARALKLAKRAEQPAVYSTKHVDSQSEDDERGNLGPRTHNSSIAKKERAAEMLAKSDQKLKVDLAQAKKTPAAKAESSGKAQPVTTASLGMKGKGKAPTPEGKGESKSISTKWTKSVLIDGTFPNTSVMIATGNVLIATSHVVRDVMHLKLPWKKLTEDSLETDFGTEYIWWAPKPPGLPGFPVAVFDGKGVPAVLMRGNTELSFGKVIKCDGNALWHTCETSKGDCNTPVVVDGKVVALHVGTKGAQRNVAFRLTPNHVAALKKLQGMPQGNGKRGGSNSPGTIQAKEASE